MPSVNFADAVRMNAATSDQNNRAVEDKIKCWLRQARDRDGGRKRRHEASVKMTVTTDLPTDNDSDSN